MTKEKLNKPAKFRESTLERLKASKIANEYHSIDATVNGVMNKLIEISKENESLKKQIKKLEKANERKTT